MTLILHTGANPVTYDELRTITTPEPTSSHVPIPHHDIVELMRYTLGFYGHEVVEALLRNGCRARDGRGRLDALLRRSFVRQGGR